MIKHPPSKVLAPVDGASAIPIEFTDFQVIACGAAFLITSHLLWNLTKRQREELEELENQAWEEYYDTHLII